MLMPIDRTNLSFISKKSVFNMQRISHPGAKDRNMKPKICLKTGILNEIERHVKIRNINDIAIFELV